MDRIAATSTEPLPKDPGWRLKRRIPFAVICILCHTVPVWAQEQTADDPAPLVEALVEYLEPGEEAEGVGEHLALELSEPLDLNRASVDELARIPLFSPVLALNVVRYRSRHGPFPAVDSLLLVPGVTPDLLRALRPFLVARPPALKSIAGGARYDLVHSIRLRTPTGSTDPSTQADSTGLHGAPYRTLTRLSAAISRRFRLSLTLENDPGEGMRWEPETHTYGYDFVSGHLLLREAGLLRTLVIGDFAADFGQGLVFSRGGAFGKGGHPVWGIARSGRGIVPYRSSDESRYFRGVAATVRVVPGVDATLLASRRRVDARLTQDECPDRTAAMCIASLSTTGLHRTPAEIDRKRAVRSDLAGVALEYTSPHLRAGGVGYWSAFAYDFQRPSSRDSLATTPRTNVLASVYAHYHTSDAHAFLEIGRSPGGVFGGIGGIQWLLSRSAEAILLMRHYPASFRSRHGFAFGERNGATQNETGYYMGLVLRVHPFWTLTAAFDQYRFPWLRRSVPRPSNGYDTYMRIALHPRQWFNAYVQVRADHSERGTVFIDDAGREVDGLHDDRRVGFRLHLESELSHTLRVRARLESVQSGTLGAALKRGILLYHDVRWAPSSRFRLDARLAYFDTDGYDARVYAFENGVTYAMSVPAFYGQGQRYYIVMSGKLFDWLMLQAKYGSTRYAYRPDDEPANSALSGQTRRDFQALARVRF